jgi:hypothetical protein
VIQGLGHLRIDNLKRACKCFEESRQFKVQKKSELLILLEKCIYKMI